MIRSEFRMRVADNGVLEIVDPGLDCLDLLMQIDDRFTVRSAPLNGFMVGLSDGMVVEEWCATSCHAAGLLRREKSRRHCRH